MPASCASACVGYWQITQAFRWAVNGSRRGRRAWRKAVTRSAGTSAPLRVFSGASITIRQSSCSSACASIGATFATSSTGASFSQISSSPGRSTRSNAYAPRRPIARSTSSASGRPSGEVFYSPVEDSTTGVIEFSEYPACYFGHEVDGVRLVFEGGRVTEASAENDGDFLEQMLATDEGARVLGEFGIGCNRGIQRHTKNTLFDEKIYGTVHFALGQSSPVVGGSNVSALHWDMVKDLRDGGRIECDGEVVQENGEWRL